MGLYHLARTVLTCDFVCLTEYEQSCHYARRVGKRGRRPGSKKQASDQPENQEQSQGLSVATPGGKPSEVGHDGGLRRPDQQSAQMDKWYELQNTSNRDMESMSNGSSPTTVNETIGGWQHISSEAIGDWKDETFDLHHSQSPDLRRNHRRHDSGLSAITDRDAFMRTAGHDALNSPNLNIYPHSLSGRDSLHASAHESAGALPQQSTITVPSLLNTPEAVTSPATARSGQREMPESARPCRYQCLAPVVSLLQGIIDADLACELLEMYFVEPGGSLFRCSSPYVLTHVIRKTSLLRNDAPRKTTPTLLVTMLWVSAQTADSSLFLLPGQKTRVCEGLRKLMVSLIQDRDRDSWHRITGEISI